MRWRAAQRRCVGGRKSRAARQDRCRRAPPPAHVDRWPAARLPSAVVVRQRRHRGQAGVQYVLAKSATRLLDSNSEAAVLMHDGRRGRWRRYIRMNNDNRHVVELGSGIRIRVPTPGARPTTMKPARRRGRERRLVACSETHPCFEYVRACSRAQLVPDDTGVNRFHLRLTRSRWWSWQRRADVRPPANPISAKRAFRSSSNPAQATMLNGSHPPKVPSHVQETPTAGQTEDAAVWSAIE